MACFALDTPEKYQEKEDNTQVGEDFPGGPVVENLPANQYREPRFDPWSGKIPLAAGELRPRVPTTKPMCCNY